MAEMEAEEVMSMSDEEIRADLESEGVDVDAWVAEVRAKLDEAVAKGWLQRDGGWVRPTVRGYDLLNDVLELFLPAN
jgi:hypothetical protein